MPAVVIARADDEIADLIDRVRSSQDPEVGLVVPSSSRALQTPLNVRLLAQFSTQSGRHTSVVTEDPRLQQLARASGLQVYGSVPAFERGIELAGPRVGGSALSRGIAVRVGGATAAAVLEPPPAPPPAPPPVSPPAHLPTSARLEPRRVLTQIPPARPKRGWDRRRFLYVAGAAVAILGIILFMTLAPSAKVTITIAATPLSVSPTIQGGVSPTAATQPDHVLTGVLSSQPFQSQFVATPTGTTTIPAVAAKATLTFSTDSTSDLGFNLPANSTSSYIQTADQSVTFAPTRSTFICIGPNNPPLSGACLGHPFNATASYVDQSSGASGNVAANSLTSWQGDPCPNPLCLGAHITVTNNSAASGGTDASQTTAASATDVANWTAQVTQIESGLSTQIQSDLTAKAAGKTFAKDPGGNGYTISYSPPKPALPAVGAPFAATTIVIAGTGQAVIYDPVAVRNDVIADLDKLVKAGDQLAPGRLNTPPCAVTQANVNGTIVLACSATDFSQPTVNLNALKAQLTGRNPGNAQKIVESNIAKVQGVSLTEWPFRLFYLPLRASQISIIENFVAPATKSP
jgi:hypothetical protein